MLPDLLAEFLAGKSDARWLTCEHDDAPAGFCFAEPEDLTDGAWNMRAIAIAPSLQGQSLGAKLVHHLEDELRAKGQRILIADTSGTDDFTPTRAFYDAIGYVQEARIRDFWGPGDDKIVYWKAL